MTRVADLAPSPRRRLLLAVACGCLLLAAGCGRKSDVLEAPPEEPAPSPAPGAAP